MLFPPFRLIGTNILGIFSGKSIFYEKIKRYCEIEIQNHYFCVRFWFLRKNMNIRNCVLLLLNMNMHQARKVFLLSRATLSTIKRENKYLMRNLLADFEAKKRAIS